MIDDIIYLVDIFGWRFNFESEKYIRNYLFFHDFGFFSERPDSIFLALGCSCIKAFWRMRNVIMSFLWYIFLLLLGYNLLCLHHLKCLLWAQAQGTKEPSVGKGDDSAKIVENGLQESREFLSNMDVSFLVGSILT